MNMRALEGKKIHFIGVNGTSISALLELSAELGATVSGSDQTEGEYFDNLKRKGFDVYTGINSEKSRNCDMVVYSGAVKENHPERNNPNTIERGRYLGFLSRFFKNTVAVAGTHGKTTTTAMISHVLKRAKKRFCYTFGGIDVEDNSNYGYFGDDLFVTEACEYRNSFLSLYPTISVITSIEYDHPDFFTNFDELKRSFEIFAKNAKKCVVLGENVENVFECSRANARIRAFDKEIEIIETNDCDFCSFRYAEKKFEIKLQVGGKFNIKNALLAFLTLTEIGIDTNEIIEGLRSFRGVKRRQEFLGYYGAKKCISDYAHHPTQIKELIDSFPATDRIAVIFEPHTYSRTKSLLSEFSTAFAKADKTIILPVYAAREPYDSAGDSKTLFDNIVSDNKTLAKNYDDAKKLIDTDNADVILFVGAGTIDDWARKLVSE